MCNKRDMRNRVRGRATFMRKTPSGKCRLVVEEIHQQDEAAKLKEVDPQAKQSVDKL